MSGIRFAGFGPAHVGWRDMWPNGFFNLRLSSGKTALCCHCSDCGTTFFEVSEDFKTCKHIKKTESRGWDRLPEIESPYSTKEKT